VRPKRATVDEARVNLHESSAGEDSLPRVLRILDASNGDKDQAVPNSCTKAPKNLDGPRLQGRARDASGRCGIKVLRDQATAVNGGVDRDQAVELESHRDVCDLIELFV
jgi:hypothetical protein